MKVNRMKKLTPDSIESVGFFKSIGAFLIDMAFTIVCLIGMYFACNGPIYKAFNGDQIFQESAVFLVDSGLIKKDETSSSPTYSAYTNNNVSIIRATDDDKDGYKIFEDKIVYYYTDFCVNYENADFNSSSDKPTQANAFIWMNQNLYNLTATSNENDYYEAYSLNGVKDYTKRPVLKEAIQAKVDARDEDTITKLYNYYFSVSEQSGLYVTAFTDVYKQPYLLTRQAISNNITYYSRLPGVIAIPLIFFIIIPLCLKNGKTLGKLFLGLSIIDKRGYKAKKWQILIHYIFIYIYWLFLLVNSLWLGIILTGFLMILDYIIRILSKQRLSLHDYASYTMVVDNNQPFYDSAKDLDDAKHNINNRALKNQESNDWESKYSRKNPDLSALKAQERVREANDVLDLSNIGQAQKEAKTITSFDDYEQGKKNDSSDDANSKP